MLDTWTSNQHWKISPLKFQDVHKIKIANYYYSYVIYIVAPKLETRSTLSILSEF